MGKKRSTGPTGETLANVWYHPQRGVRISIEPQPAPWHVVTKVYVVARSGHGFRISPGQRLPNGFLWADPSKQRCGLSGPFLAYGPIERRCSDCKQMFTWPAAAQQHLYETIGAIVHASAARCQACARAKRVREDARIAYADALRALARAQSRAAHVRGPRAA